MGLLQLAVLLICVGLAAEAEGAPWRSYDTHSQACGDKLADLLNLVCSGRGYNMAFRPEGSSARRVRRGIVEECCHRSCSFSLLELYCRADPTEGPTNVQIRKRSDSGVESQSTETEYTEEPHTTQHLTEHTTTQATTHRHTTETTPPDTHTQQHMELNTLHKHNTKNYKLLNLLSSMEHKRHHARHNDTTEDLSPEQVLRHHKHHPHKLRLLRHKALAKARHAKNTSRESLSFQIGTVKPYFAGRALVSHR